VNSGQVRQSKGFAFIKFKDLEAQEKVLLTRHMIQDRWCDVKVSEKQEKKNAKVAASSKIFVARLSATITTEDLKAQYIYLGQ
jgi:RNA recognition motif-containing protein